ncbi:MAG TPA: rhomboid family intramembrane serine protease [Vicinamibacterales bacterium]|nr:rhomboid family intramembrane serine protease [Vicinamibacterales bacterium]
MIPLRDVIPSRTTPWVTMGLIAANVALFIRQLTFPGGFDESIFEYGLVPAQATWASLLTSMFAHAGWVHIGSNMLCLWIFGDNVEDRMGHVRFLVFYLVAGAAAGLLQMQMQAGGDALIPLVGASGAIAGVMGAYLFLYPHSRIHVLIFFVFFIDVIEVPALIFLGLWFLMQVLGGVGQVAGQGGVAFWAHVGGFLTGAAAGLFFRRTAQDWTPID